MHRLLLLRHAKSTWDDPALSDHARPLNARGRRAAAGMGAAMRGMALRPDLVLVSSARRTLQTLEALGVLEGSPRVEPMDDLYLAPWRRLLEAAQAVPDEVGTVLAIAHNPGLHELALELTGPDDRSADARVLAGAYPTCSLAEFAFEGPWVSLRPGGARLVRFLTPSNLPEPAA
ncbi:SixA phosphatase family protein [Muricoccus radiodurans]|uniref:SixA phosphatase family protein n=1 Tax=Muricoccus radiodurans TaxID=2231721 RepID=UPI003CEF6356